MKKTYEKVTQERQSGYTVVLINEFPYATMHINMNGDVISIDYDSSIYTGGGFCTYTKDNFDFRVQVKSFMKELLERDLNEFKNMRNVLTGEWHEMAENVRKQAISKFDF